MIRPGTSEIPPEKLTDPRLADLSWVKDLEVRLQDKAFRMGVCLHEAAHAEYMLRAGASRVTLHPPQVLFNRQTDEFEHGSAGAKAHWDKDAQVGAMDMARWHVAGGVAMRVLTGVVDGGDESDFRIFSEEAARRGGFAGEQVSEAWEKAKRDVETDLLSPTFQVQLWDRARDFERQLLEMLEVHSEPA